MGINGHSCLVLNGDFSPLNICTSLKAVKMVYAGRAELVEGIDNGPRTITDCYPLPTVIRIPHRILTRSVRVRLSRKAVLFRDRFICQYCGANSGRMTVDHLIPKNQGGEFTWDNLVCACISCNTRKADRPLESSGLKIRKRPKEPSYFALSLLYHNHRGRIDDSWGKYLPTNLWKMVNSRNQESIWLKSN